MKIKKLIIASLAAFVLLGAPAVQAEEKSTSTQEERTDTPFSDIKGHWAEKEITQLYNSGAIQGNDAGLYRPDDAITRAELITLFLAAKGIKPIADNTVTFADIPADSWLAPYAVTAYQLGFIHGREEKGKLYLAPDQPVQRQELITILLQAKGDSGKVNQMLWSTSLKALKAYPDQEQIDTSNQRAVAYALQQNVANAFSDGGIKPLQNMTRAEAAIYAYHHLFIPAQSNVQRIAEIQTPYKQAITVETTSYAEMHVKSYLGWPLRKGIVAVDPKVIPLGTHLYIEGYGYAVAADIGGAVKEKHIDVFLPSLQAALAYGRQKDTKVYILD